MHIFTISSTYKAKENTNLHTYTFKNAHSTLGQVRKPAHFVRLLSRLWAAYQYGNLRAANGIHKFQSLVLDWIK